MKTFKQVVESAQITHEVRDVDNKVLHSKTYSGTSHNDAIRTALKGAEDHINKNSLKLKDSIGLDYQHAKARMKNGPVLTASNETTTHHHFLK